MNAVRTDAGAMKLWVDKAVADRGRRVGGRSIECDSGRDRRNGPETAIGGADMVGGEVRQKRR